MTTKFLYAGNSVLVEKQGSTTTAKYTYGNALIRKDGETFLYDVLGSSRQSTNSSQTVTASWTYEGFGQTVASSGTSTSTYKFAATSGYRDDGDAGLVQVGARYDDPQVGRFITRDANQDQNPYAYSADDPANQTTPTGYTTDQNPQKPPEVPKGPSPVPVGPGVIIPGKPPVYQIPPQGNVKIKIPIDWPPQTPTISIGKPPGKRSPWGGSVDWTPGQQLVISANYISRF